MPWPLARGLPVLRSDEADRLIDTLPKTMHPGRGAKGRCRQRRQDRTLTVSNRTRASGNSFGGTSGTRSSRRSSWARSCWGSASPPSCGMARLHLHHPPCRQANRLRSYLRPPSRHSRSSTHACRTSAGSGSTTLATDCAAGTSSCIDKLRRTRSRGPCSDRRPGLVIGSPKGGASFCWLRRPLRSRAPSSWILPGPATRRTPRSASRQVRRTWTAIK